ncbi:MAG TPA: hypothetical protein VJ573_09115, partial [Actinomycetota bacterium]|nr:hypothetical protein [Actinomycetota bacterium]
DGSQAGAAAAGWDGGTYRAWSNGTDTAVELSTVWDTAHDAEEFAASMGEWIEQGDGSATVLDPEGKAVTVLFASDAATLGMLETAVG